MKEHIAKPSQLNDVVERELYSTRFRRNLNGLMKKINNPNAMLRRVIVKSRRTEQAVMVAMSATDYTTDTNYLKAHKHLLDQMK